MYSPCAKSLREVALGRAGNGKVGKYSLRIGVDGEYHAKAIQDIWSWMIAGIFLGMKREDAAIGGVGDDGTVPAILREGIKASGSHLRRKKLGGDTEIAGRTEAILRVQSPPSILPKRHSRCDCA